MGALVIIIWLVVVLPILIFAGGYLGALALNAAAQKLAGSETSGTDSASGSN